MSSKARISKFLGPKGQRQIAQARLAVASVPLRPTIKSLDRRVKRINAKDELKHLDTNFAGSVISTTATIQGLNLMVRGTTSITRIADDISCTSIQWRFRMITDQDNLVPSFVRHMVLWDSQPNGAVPAIGEILDLATITGPLHAPYNSNFQKRFKILHDRTMVLNPQVVLAFTPGTGATDDYASVGMVFKGKRQLSRTAKYDTNVGDITDLQSNALISVFVSNQATDGPILNGGYRLIFKDD